MGTYGFHKPLHMGDDQPHMKQFPVGAKSFDWVENNATCCVLAFCRHWKGERPVLAIFNFGCQYHHGYTIGISYTDGAPPGRLQRFAAPGSAGPQLSAAAGAGEVRRSQGHAPARWHERLGPPGGRHRVLHGRHWLLTQPGVVTARPARSVWWRFSHQESQSLPLVTLRSKRCSALHKHGRAREVSSVQIDDKAYCSA
eukprot:s2049_g1.t1